MRRARKISSRLAVGAGILAAAFAMILATSGPVLGVHESPFQLEGDIVASSNPYTTPPFSGATVDWDSLYNVSGTGVATPKAPASLPAGFKLASFTEDYKFGPLLGTADDTDTSDDTTFTTGSKDILRIGGGGWQCTHDNNVNDKDDIVNAYATVFVHPTTGHTILYFALERFDAGEANVGFWFFEDETVGCSSTAGAINFTGGHTDGDLLVLSTFTGGGRISDVDVLQWDGDDATGSLNVTTPVASGVDCKETAVGDNVCATVNSAPQSKPNDPPPPGGIVNGSVTPPWRTVDKDSDTALNPTQFFEGGLDITALGLGGTCFGRYMADTRASQSPPANLHDFALGGLPLCDLAVTKTGDAFSKTGDTVNYTVTIHNIGAATLYKQDIDDTLIGAITTGGADQANSAITSNTCGASLAPDDGVAGGADECTITYSHTVTAGEGAGSSLENTVTVVYDSESGLDGDELTRSDPHTVTLVHPSIDVEKTGDAFSKTGDTINYTITIHNTGDTTLNKSSITDANATLTIPAACDSLAADDGAAGGADECTITGTHTVTAAEGAGNTFSNTVSVIYVLPASFNLSNQITDSDTFNTTLVHPSIDVEKTGDAFSKTGDTINYSITIHNTGDTTLNKSSITDANATLTIPAACDSLAADDGAAGGADECTITGTHTVTAAEGAAETFTNTVSVIYVLPASFNLSNQITDQDSFETDIVHPNYTITKSCVTNPVPAGSSAIFNVDIANTGDTPLHFVLNEESTFISGTGVTNFSSGSGQTTFDLAVGGSIRVEVTKIAGSSGEVGNDITATATLPASYGLSNQIIKSANASCPIQSGGATRTQGFWATHIDYTTHIFSDPNHNNGAPIDLGWKTITGTDDIFGIFWASVSKQSDGSKRSLTCQACVIGSQQLLAAILNTYLDNGAPVPIDSVTGLDLITAMRNALAAKNRPEILRLTTLLDDYNNSGDGVAIIDFDGTVAGRADPKAAKAAADIPFADC